MNSGKSKYLLHFIITLLFCSVSLNSNGQSVGLSTGVGYASFFDLVYNSQYDFANYKRGSHQFLRLDLDSYIPDANFLSINFKLERSVSSIETSGFAGFMICGPISSNFITAPNLSSDITIYRLSVGLMPINWKIYNNIRFKAGVELTKVFRTKNSELDDLTVESENIFITNRQNIDDVINEFGTGFIFELQLGKFTIREDLSIFPIYNSSFSLTEDIRTGFYTRTLRQSLGFAIKWNMKPKL